MVVVERHRQVAEALPILERLTDPVRRSEYGHQVADLAGVSVASASRALNGMVASAQTIAKVRAAAAELGYLPDATARSLKLGHSLQLAFAVGMVVADAA